jgi:hypothetical protein
VFGVDFLLHDGKVVVIEMNPRFQASTFLSEFIARAQGVTGPYLEHLASFLGLDPPAPAEFPPLAVQTRDCWQLRGSCPLAQIISYNDRGSDLRVAAADRSILPAGVELIGVPDLETVVAQNAMLGKVLARDPVTANGYTLLEPYAAVRGVFRTRQVL